MRASIIFNNRVLLEESHRLMMSSTSEAHSKRMGSSWDGNANGGGGGGDSLQGISCPSNWLRLGIGPFREDGSNGKGKVTDEEEKADAGFYAEEERVVSPSLSRMREEMIESRRESGNAIKRMRMSDEKEDFGNGSSTEHGYAMDAHKEGIGFSAHREDMWLVVDLYDKTRRLCEGIVLINVRRRLFLRKIFSEESWTSSHSEWVLRAADGDLLVYTSKSNGSIRVLNPFTMETIPLHNMHMGGKSSISYYMRRYHDDVAVHLKFDSSHKTFEVTLVIGNDYLVNTKKEFFVLVYKSAAQAWQIRKVNVAENARGSGITINLFPKIFVQNNKVYCFKIHGERVVTYDLNGDSGSMFHYNLGRMGDMHHEVLGIVMYKGRITMVCTRTQDLPAYTHTLSFYIFDELGLKWRSEHAPIVLPHSLFGSEVICCGGDYIWLIKETNGYVSQIIYMDLDKRELKICPDVFQTMSKAINCLSFCPCP